MSDVYVLPLSEVGLADLAAVGGKNASLGELLRELGKSGVRVPQGFAVTTAAFRLHLREAGLEGPIAEALAALDTADVASLSRTSLEIRTRIQTAALPTAVREAVRTHYVALAAESGDPSVSVAVRSSATAEDLPTASFAGQQETMLNVRGESALEQAVLRCMASLYLERAIVYRAERGIAHAAVALSVGVQRMVLSDLGCSGVMFTLDPESGFRDMVLINGSWGLGETIVQGRVNPDEYWIHKPTLRQGYASLVRRELGDKAVRLVYADSGAAAVREERVSRHDRVRFVLEDAEALELARLGMAIEDHYSRRADRPVPMDIEWAKDGITQELFIVQARPETVHAQAKPAIDVYSLQERSEVLVRGRSVGSRIGAGPVRIVRQPADLQQFQTGDVLVAEMTDPDWEPVLARAAAVVTDQGGRTCHAAIISRELGIPCVVGTSSATHALQEGQLVTVSCAEGEEGRVYAGRLAFRREALDPSELPQPRVPLQLNLAHPDSALALAQLPSAGVGLLRLEFLITNWIGVHPMALLQPERVSDPQQRAAIAERTRGAASGPEFFVERLASGVAWIAAAFYPRPVVVRFSDFKTNEYARLLGGSPFEPTEANPVIGFRGASRYIHELYREGFALECAALRRARERFGLTNIRLMIPFCRTLEEGRAVLAELARHGLRRGENGLEVIAMCEIPNNVILAEEFCELFDGFSIGSNDLTQLALGVDRDSELLAHLFDERDPGVKRLIEMVVSAAHRRGRKVGICGQAPSDHPEFAEFLAGIGIDSISLNPDSLVAVTRRLASPAR
jgi:pyruvate,water dikinase